MEKQVEHVSIDLAKNGGFIVRVRYRARPVKRGGAMSGGIAMEYPEPDEHVFGADERAKMLAFVTKKLDVSKE